MLQHTAAADQSQKQRQQDAQKSACEKMPGLALCRSVSCRNLNSVCGIVTTLLLILCPRATAESRAAESRMIEVADDSSSYVGKIISMNDSHCCLVDRFGRMEQLPVRSLKSYRVVAERYQPATAAEIRRQLSLEFPGYEVDSSTHYLVACPRGRSQSYAALFEDIYRQVEQFYRVRGFRTHSPDTALTAIVFGTWDEFAEYCRKDDVASPSTLKGYYSFRSNRVVLFDDPRLFSARPATPGRLPGRPWPAADTVRLLPDADSVARPILAAPVNPSSSRGIAGPTADTIVHETTHQVGHNIGIHSRLGGTPTWILEGLATVLESPGVRNGSAFAPAASRHNRERLDWFRTKYAERQSAGDIARLAASDEMFQRQTLDAYSLAWALTFYLSENAARTRQLAAYIRTVESRDITKQYTSAERLQDFQNAFGDIARLEVEFLRFMDRLP